MYYDSLENNDFPGLGDVVFFGISENPEKFHFLSRARQNFDQKWPFFGPIPNRGQFATDSEASGQK